MQKVAQIPSMSNAPSELRLMTRLGKSSTSTKINQRPKDLVELGLEDGEKYAKIV